MSASMDDAPDASLAPEVLELMRRIIATAIATRRASLAEAAAEARGLARGRHPKLPYPVIDAAVDGILRDLGAQRPPLPLPELAEDAGAPLVPALPEEVADALAYAMRFDERGKARRTGHEYAAHLAADQLLRYLGASGFVVARRRPPASGGG